MATNNTTAIALCGSNSFPFPCPLTPPLDGHGGTCYSQPFPIPICPTADYGAIPEPSPPSLESLFFSTSVAHFTGLQRWHSFESLDRASEILSLHAATYAFSMAMCVVTLANVLALTPGRKQGGILHSVVLGGLVAQIVRDALELYLRTGGPMGAMYLVLTRDWASTRWSWRFRACETLVQITSLVVLGCIEVAFFVQGKGMMVWLKIRYRPWVYLAFLGGLSGLGVMAFAYRLAYAYMRIRWVAFAKEGEWWHLSTAYFVLAKGSLVCVCLSIMVWSVCFFVSSTWIVWERRKLFLCADMFGTGESTDTIQPPRSRSRKVKAVNGYENTLKLIGLVAVQSFAIPIILCILSFLRMASILDCLIMSSCLTLLPMSSLFAAIGSRQETPREPPNASLPHTSPYETSHNSKATSQT